MKRPDGHPWSSGEAVQRLSHVVVANPGADVYGSDLQMLESVSAFVGAGHQVTVVLPGDGPLIPQLVSRGAHTEFLSFPVLRRTDQSIAGLARLGLALVHALPRMVRFLRRVRADVVYVNTVTIPWWMLAGRLVRSQVVCHVHEAEEHSPIAARLALYAPLTLATKTIVNGSAAKRSVIATVPRLAGRLTTIFNGVADRPEPPSLPPSSSVTRVGVVARLTPRKGTLDALEAIAAARDMGADCELHLFGSVFPGYEWFEQELCARSEKPDLAGRVHFHGYTRPVWAAFDAVDIVLAPSHVESYGNSVVEAQLSMRPVVASRAAGHLESIVDGETGVLVDIGDSCGMASAIMRLTSDRSRADRLAQSARASALERNSISSYRAAVGRIVEEMGERCK